MKRTLAWIGILAIVIGFIALVYFTATGASANVIMAALFCMIVIPIFIYAFLMVLKMKNKDQDESK
ncbi:MAG: phosphate ABC transporter substrate-binding protein [Lachnospiraceae bacterium]|nr:phosphate ABC transporter substrate-binding protein [Lachnospiraceae bacterium]